MAAEWLMKLIIHKIVDSRSEGFLPQEPIGDPSQPIIKLKVIFSKLTINYQAWSNRGEMSGDSKELESQLVGHLMTRLLAMVSVGSQLAQRSDRELMSIQRGASLVIILSIVILAAMMAVNSILMGRSIVRPIRKLQKDTEIVGKGNLDYPLATAANDELGELSRSFEQMARNLKTVMASRDELKNEIQERKKAELALRESEEKYSKLFHANPQWLSFSTLDDGRYLEINEAIKRDRKSKLDQAEINEIQKRVDSLTKREKEVFALVVRGLLNKQIAFELGTSEKTVKVHRGRVMEKMQAESLADLVRMAERIGIDKTKIPE
jgi:DNA-binding NarL/FixJ family response regulator